MSFLPWAWLAVFVANGAAGVYAAETKLVALYNATGGFAALLVAAALIYTLWMAASND